MDGLSSFDEKMEKYEGDDPAVEYIPRKPDPEGIRIFLWCFVLKHTNRPVCYLAIQDIRTPRYKVSELMEAIRSSRPTKKKIILTMDSYFGSLSTIESFNDNGVICFYFFSS